MQSTRLFQARYPLSVGGGKLSRLQCPDYRLFFCVDCGVFLFRFQCEIIAVSFIFSAHFREQAKMSWSTVCEGDADYCVSVVVDKEAVSA